MPASTSITRTAAARKAAPPRRSSSASTTRSVRRPRRACDEALRRDDGRDGDRGGRGRPRAPRQRGLVAADAPGAPRDHPRGDRRGGRARRAARDPPGRAVILDRPGRNTAAFLLLALILFSA